MEALSKFVQLNNRNWQTWKFRMEMVLTKEELWYEMDTRFSSKCQPNWTFFLRTPKRLWADMRSFF